FDFSCDASFLMLDINAPQEGEVDEHFVPYDAAVSEELFTTFCERWGLKVSEEGTAELMGIINGYECTP
ncbi:MAG TPA: hypothetical protein VE960_00230, partial [bacterium]|nr:hypothetical protein [bacterium]